MPTAPVDEQALKAHYDRGQALREAGQLDEALAAYDAALAIKSDAVHPLVARGIALRQLGRHEAALDAYEAALAVDPTLGLVHCNRGNTLHDLMRFEEALQAYDRGLQILPDFADLLANRASTLLEFRRLDEAEASCERAIKMHPPAQAFHAHMTLGLIKLLRGRFKEGFNRPGWRRFLANGQGRFRGFDQPLWWGETPLRGRTLLLHDDQGLGDAIQFSRYAALFAQDARVVLEVPKPLIRLMRGLKGPSQVIAFGEPPPPFDIRLALSSTPYAAGDLLPMSAPYLSAPEAEVKAWAERLGPWDRPRVGIAWAGSQAIKTNISRFLPLDALLAAIPEGVEVAPLQPSLSLDDATRLDATGVRRTDLQITDFADTAGLMANLDLIVSVDTSVIHLAGALGMQGRLLTLYTPDWRWLLDREDSPWYPSLRLYRQARAGDWALPLERLRTELEGLKAQRGKTTA